MTRLRKLAHQFYALSIREKSLILAVGLLVILLGGYLLLVEPPLKTASVIEQQITQAQSRVANMRQQIAEIQQLLNQDVDALLRDKVELLQVKQVELDQQLTSQMSHFVAANQMPKLLANMLAKVNEVNLVSLESIPPTRILTDPEHEDSQLQIYQHGVKLVLDGHYFAVQQYLQQLKDSQWDFYWYKFDYRVDEYPVGIVELELYTLSTSPAFMGI
ncbi:type II secretion system protein GspM [Neptunicella sp. SCSIO 80796]|uniref:type II secretion system protein GspM n=1 Tax=Neptunicella plasticusilytica TaxID=3117012 RepID=UPI003A4DF1C2